MFGISMIVLGYTGVTVDTAEIFTGPVVCFRAKSMLERTSAAAPSLVAQMSSKCSGSATTAEPRTSSTLTSFL